jgi:hypothetical protein
MWEEAAAPYQGVTLRLPVGGRGYWGADEEASKDFEKISRVKSIWETSQTPNCSTCCSSI